MTRRLRSLDKPLARRIGTSDEQHRQAMAYPTAVWCLSRSLSPPLCALPRQRFGANRSRPNSSRLSLRSASVNLWILLFRHSLWRDERDCPMMLQSLNEWYARIDPTRYSLIASGGL